MTRQGDSIHDVSSLFLGSTEHAGDSGDGAGARIAASRPSIGLVLQGHLPVYGGLWLSQFGDWIGQRSGPACLVRYEHDALTLEILRGDGRRLVMSPGQDIQHVLKQASAFIRNWLVVVPSQMPVQEMASLDADRICILTGADKAAIVGCYGLVKDLAATWSESDLEHRPIELVVVGAEQNRAIQVCEHLNRMSAEHMELELPLLGALQKAGPIDSTVRISIPLEKSISVEELIHLMHQLEEHRSDRFDEPAATAVKPPPGQLAIEPEPQSDRAEHVIASISHGQLLQEEQDDQYRHIASAVTPLVEQAEHPGPDEEQLEVTQVAEPVEMDPVRSSKLGHITDLIAETAEAARKSEQGKASSTQADGLLGLIHGLQPLEFSCPGCSEVELAVDSMGQLHLVAHVDHVDRLHAAAKWARDNARLLSSACGRLGASGSFKIMRDVITSDPDRIIQFHGTGFLLHLKGAVKTPGGTHEFCTPLNSLETAGSTDA